MRVTEFQIKLPMTVDSYQVAQLFTVAEVSKSETGGGQGIRVLVNEPFDENTHAPNPPLLGGKYTLGQYTLKKYFLEKKVPTFIRSLINKNALIVTEEAWNAYPYCRTVITSDYFSAEKFKLTIESLHSKDFDLENVHQLEGELLQLRNIQDLNIADNNEATRLNIMREEYNPKIFQSKKTGVGPLNELEWYKNDSLTTKMCAYKLVTVQAKVFGLQNIIEDFVLSQEGKLFLDFHRKLYCYMDDWHGMDMAKVREYEEKTKEDLSKQFEEEAVRGTVAS